MFLSIAEAVAMGQLRCCWQLLDIHCDVKQLSLPCAFCKACESILIVVCHCVDCASPALRFATYRINAIGSCRLPFSPCSWPF